MDIQKRLKNKALLASLCYVGGKWVGATGKKTKNVTDPASGKTIGKVPVFSPKDVEKAIEAAHAAGEGWKKKTAKERSDILRKWYQLMLENAEDLANIMTAEQGKPLTEARSEIAYAASFVEWFAEEAKRVRGDIIPTVNNDRRLLAIRQPVGVVAAITPWNFPSAMITRKVAPALAAGCTVVIKPAIRTPYSALALAKLAELAGIPPGVLNVVLGEAAEVGKVLSTHPLVRKISFTGSTAVGKLLLKQGADTMKRVSLELGGNAPFIVFDDANVDLAVKGAVASKYRNAGQACTSTNRMLVQAGVHDVFAQKIVENSKKLKVCSGFLEGAQQGPLIDQRAFDKVEELVADAVAKGAKILTGGKRHKLGGTFYEPTVIVNATRKMRVFKEEIFGPVSVLFKFKTEEEALQMANDTSYGLASYFYTEDYSRIWRVAEGLEYGMVGANESLISTFIAPFGGMKESGLGREGSHLGIQEFLEVKYICMGHIS
jgi:succinate-semialdehyde dehydrogenase/glutarate-semialdehyde dehydrogenase